MTERRNDVVCTVAIVDDEEDITTYLRIALEDAGYRVVITNDASKAMAVLEDARPDLICLDLLMPERTGVSLYARLREHPGMKRVPILFLSGLAEQSTVFDAAFSTSTWTAPASASILTGCYPDRPMKAALCSATGKVNEKAGQALKGIKAKVQGDAAAAE